MSGRVTSAGDDAIAVQIEQEIAAIEAGITQDTTDGVLTATEAAELRQMLDDARVALAAIGGAQ